MGENLLVPFRNNNPTSAYALPILQNRHKYGPMNTTMNLLKPLSNPSLLTPHKLFFIQSFHKEGKLISEQNPGKPTLFFNWPLTHPTNPRLEKPVRQHSLHSAHILLPDCPASQQLQQVCAISIFPLPSTYQTPHTTPAQTVLQTVPYSCY